MKLVANKPNTLYVAFLRGINVGGYKKVPMSDLKRIFEGMGFGNVRTLLASGNVIFDFDNTSETILEKRIESNLENAFGFPIKTLIIEMNDIKNIVASEPFKGIEVTQQMRLFVTLLNRKPTAKLTVPFTTPDGSFRILQVTDKAVFSVFTVMSAPWSAGVNLIEKEFGPDVTTRNWNTILKVARGEKIFEIPVDKA